jgi:hypothetical protein
MKTLLTLLLATLCAATSYGQTIKALGYNTTNGQVAYSGTNTLNFSNAFTVAGELSVTAAGISGFGGTLSFEEALFNANGGNTDWALGGSGFTEAGVIAFLNTTNAAITRTNLGLPLPALTNTNFTNFRSAIGLGWSALTNTNVTNFLAAIGLSATNDVVFNSVNVTNAAATRTNLGLPLQALTNSSVTNFRAAIGLSLPALTNTSNVTTMRALAGSTNTNEPFSGTIEYLNHTSNPFYLDVSNGIILRRYE